MKAPELKGGQMITIAYLVALLIGVFVIYRVLGTIGLIKTRAKKKATAAKSVAEESLRSSEWFDPLFLKDKTSVYVPLKEKAKTYAIELYKAMHKLGTDEEAVYAIFSRLDNKWNISEVALYYRLGYKKELLTDILNELTQAEQVTLWNIISKLPNA